MFEEYDFYLTPQGWVVGSVRNQTGIVKSVLPPNDYVCLKTVSFSPHWVEERRVSFQDREGVDNDYIVQLEEKYELQNPAPNNPFRGF